MAALRTLAHSIRKSSSIPPVPRTCLYGSFFALRHNPIQAASLSMQTLSPHPTYSSRRSFTTVIQFYERGLLFRLGKHSGEKEDPGRRLNIPIFHEIRKVDMRTRILQVPSQELITKDNVTIHVDAVAFCKVEDPLKAICNIEDYDAAVNEAAQVGAFCMAVRSLLPYNQKMLIHEPATDLGARSALSCNIRRSFTRP